MRRVSLNELEVAHLAHLVNLTQACQLEKAARVLGPNSRLANKLAIIAMNMKPGQCVHVPIPETEAMNDTDDITPEKIIHNWHELATDEHLLNFDPNDPMTDEEVNQMVREINCSDMRFPEEFLRRTQ